MKNLIRHISEDQLVALANSDDGTIRSLAAEVLQLRARPNPDEMLHEDRVDVLVRPERWPHHPLKNIGAVVQEIYDNCQLQRLSIEMAGFRVAGYPVEGKTTADTARAICHAVERKR